MINTDILIVGGGPAGLCAAIEAAKAGASVVVMERDRAVGGQLVKQTHMFFGSQKQYASTRGIDICTILTDEIATLGDKVKIVTNATVLGMYEDGVITAEHDGKYIKVKPKATIVATGASEKFLTFPGNDLPGIYGAGAVQTLMNVYGVKPGDEVVMVGAGNIGLIVSYQLMQAGVKVNAIVDAAPSIGGYLVHASKIRRMGVPIHTSTTVKKAHGTDKVVGVTLERLDESWAPVPNSEFYLPCDNLCISVGLSPLAELLWQLGCDMKFVPALGGHVPMRNAAHRTSLENVYVAGDVSGVEEASSAMVGGRIAGLSAACDLGFTPADAEENLKDLHEQAESLRSGPVGDRIRVGLAEASF